MIEPYSKIQNTVLDALPYAGLGGYEYRILLIIMRKTYGFNKDVDYITQSQISKLSAIHFCHVSRVIKSLLEKNIITKSKKLIGIQKDVTAWEVKNKDIIKNLPNMVSNTDNKEDKNLPNMVSELTKNGKKNLPNMVNTKNIRKLNKEKTVFPSSNFNQDLKEKTLQLVEHLNEKASKRFKPLESDYILVAELLEQGFTVDDAINVIDVKCSQWAKDPIKHVNLRPRTLFKIDNFMNYINEVAPTIKPVKILMTEELTLNQASVSEMANVISKDIREHFSNNGKTAADIDAIIDIEVNRIEEAVQVIGHSRTRQAFDNLKPWQFTNQIKEYINAKVQNRKACHLVY